MILNEPERLLIRRQVTLITGLSRTTLWRYGQEGRFPQPRRMPGGELRWLESEIMAWIYGLPLGSDDTPEIVTGRYRRICRLKRLSATAPLAPDETPAPSSEAPGEGV